MLTTRTALKLAYVAGLVSTSVVRASYRRRSKQNTISAHHGTTLDSLLLSLASLGLVIAPALYVVTTRLNFANYRLPRGAGGIGLAVYGAAIWLIWRSHSDLGRNWSATLEIRDEHSLVTEGVYRYVRHPMYAGHWLWALAQPLLLQNWIAGLATLATFPPLYFYRAGPEEQMMLDRFGEQYRSYMGRTGRVIPQLG